MQQMAIPHFLTAVSSWSEKYRHKPFEQGIYVEQETTARRGKQCIIENDAHFLQNYEPLVFRFFYWGTALEGNQSDNEWFRCVGTNVGYSLKEHLLPFMHCQCQKLTVRSSVYV
jgi:hypothetical protein